MIARKIAATALAALVALPCLGLAGCSQPARQGVPEPAATASVQGFDYASLPAYDGHASVTVNGRQPFFTASEREHAASEPGFESYGKRDSLGRCTAAVACVGPETMPADGEKRGSIGMVKPTGWRTARYDGVDGGYLYNRCHLIAWCLGAENANEDNLVTGTRAMNTEGMLPWEEKVARYIDETGNHVLYRSTPVFEGEELVCRGVLIEAESVEDGGAGIEICEWCWNVQPGIEIDYATGESSEA